MITTNTSLRGVRIPTAKTETFSILPGANFAIRDMSAHKLRVLVVEDNPINCELARNLLYKLGQLAVAVTDGQQALSEWRKGSYDLILMDIQMPVMDGPTATRCIRAEEKVRGGHIPIIALTAHALKQTEAECILCGMDGYVPKPLNRERLVEIVDKFAPPSAPAAQAPTIKSLKVKKRDPLIRREGMVRHAGQDPALQRQIVRICQEALTERMPILHKAINSDDRVLVKNIAHVLRGTLGMLGLPTLIRISEQLEYEYATLSEARWVMLSEQFYQILLQLNHELRDLTAA